MTEREALRNLGNTHCHMEDFKAAKDYHECDLKIAKELADRLGKRELCRAIGKTLRQLADSTESESMI